LLPFRCDVSRSKRRRRAIQQTTARFEAQRSDGVRNFGKACAQLHSRYSPMLACALPRARSRCCVASYAPE
jgi:hypothetical protein